MPQRRLSWFDSVAIGVGTIIGAGIFQTSGAIAASVPNVWQLMGLWILGGVFSLCGAMCYAELASTYPRAGGDYVYLSRAYGSLAGFLFGWLQALVVRPGDIAVVAFIFATYLGELLKTMLGVQPTAGSSSLIAAMAVLFLTVLNVLDVRFSTLSQNILTGSKVLGVVIVIAACFFAPSASSTAEVPSPSQAGSFSVAMILVLFTYGGWNEMAYLAAEVKSPQRVLPRVFLTSIGLVIVLYLGLNAAFLRMLGLDGMQSSQAIASDALSTVWPSIGGIFISALICVSTLGTANGMIFTGSRIGYAVGQEHHFFRKLGQWNPQTRTPKIALFVQGSITILLILAFGSFLTALLYTAAVVYSFYLATGLSLLVLRWKEPNTHRPYRVTWFPIPWFLFCASALFMAYSAIQYNPAMARWALVLVVVGMVAWAADRTRQKEFVERQDLR